VFGAGCWELTRKPSQSTHEQKEFPLYRTARARSNTHDRERRCTKADDCRDYRGQLLLHFWLSFRASHQIINTPSRPCTPHQPTTQLMLHRTAAVRHLGRACQHCGWKRLQSTSHIPNSSSITCAAAPAAQAVAKGSGMDTQLEQLVRDIHASPYKAVVYVTGGAAQVNTAAVLHCNHHATQDAYHQLRHLWRGLSLPPPPTHTHTHSHTPNLTKNATSIRDASGIAVV